ncbi:MAG TPA: GTP cyclohydrolase MptA [Candidatus Thermoplasmatota archaeon]|nr:GTP cyclohydrolase MptA [Candidatus Thermoplasmatota archaeon]
MRLPDVQSHRAPRPIRLTRVGVTDVVKPVRVSRGGRANHLVASFDVFVDLPAEQRGTHMSRNIEVINRLIDEHVRKETASLEDLASGIAHALLDRHEYAAEAEAHVSADYFRERRTPQNQAPTLERYALFASALVARGQPERRTIGVEVVGMTACPCAMEGSRAILAARGHDVADFPTITHNQRNVATLLVETGPGHMVEADELLDVAEASLSAPTFELLKRGDETALVMQAHDNPRFVEDVVREMLHAVRERWASLPDDTLVIARSVAEESIHKHNAFAERTATLGELRG